MARARNIKPSLFKNEILGQADPLLTILFASLWTIADKEGRLEDRPMRIKAETFPYRDVDVNGYLTQLVSLGFIWRYVIDENAYIQVINFAKHQSPHSTEKTSSIPECPKEYRTKSMNYKILPLVNESASVNAHINVLIPDSLNTDLLKPLTPKPHAKKRARDGVINYDNCPDFSKFWEMYPNKTGKSEAYKAWKNHKPVLANIATALSWQTRLEKWTKDNGSYIPNPSTYINQHRWEDEQPAERKTSFENVDYLKGVNADGTF